MQILISRNTIYWTWHTWTGIHSWNQHFFWTKKTSMHACILKVTTIVWLQTCTRVLVACPPPYMQASFRVERDNPPMGRCVIAIPSLVVVTHAARPHPWHLLRVHVRRPRIYVVSATSKSVTQPAEGINTSHWLLLHSWPNWSMRTKSTFRKWKEYIMPDSYSKGECL
jgi:hypothetical protein